MTIVEDVEKAVEQAMIEYGPDGHTDGAREIAAAALEVCVPHMVLLAGDTKQEENSMAEISEHETPLTTALVREMHQCAGQNHQSAARAHRTVVLASHSLENYEPGSPWHIAEAAILNAAKRIYVMEKELAESFETAAKQIAALGT